MSKLLFTLKAWPMIAIATIGLCFVTELVAAGLGITLPEQANLNVVRNCLTHAFDNPRLFWASLLLLAQVIVIMPVVEEIYFRHFLFNRNNRQFSLSNLGCAFIPSCVFAGIAIILPLTIPQARIQIEQATPNHTWLVYAILVTAFVVLEFAIRVLLGRAVAKTSRYSAAIFSSILFSAAHYISQPWPDTAFLALFIFGLAQCWLYVKTERLWCTMLNHALFNLTNLVLLFIVPQS